ncbi:MAG: hypothetical protein ACRCTA_04335, partial [Bacilli bacterium]
MEKQIVLNQSTKFKTNYLQVRYLMDASSDKITYANLLAMYLTYCNNIDDTYKKASDHLDQLYGVKFDINVSIKGYVIVFDFLISFISSRYLIASPSYLEEVITLLFTYINDPKKQGQDFDEYIFNLKQRDLKQRLELAYDDKRSYALEL